MARAGYCSGCGTNVWLTPEGGCQNGHGAEFISGAYEAQVPAPSPAPAPAPSPSPAPAPAPTPVVVQHPPKKNKTCLIVAIVLAALLLLCGCGSALVFIVGGRTLSSASSDAQERSCFANERTFEGAAMQLLADSPDAAYPTDVQTLVDAGFIKSELVCPGGGSYTVDADAQTLTCSVHGHY